VRRFLPRTYLEEFVDPDASLDGSPAVWVHRPAIGVFQAAPLEPGGRSRHFNEVEEPALQKNDDLEHLLGGDRERRLEAHPREVGIAHRAFPG
jgi:hypothetical protein